MPGGLLAQDLAEETPTEADPPWWSAPEVPDAGTTPALSDTGTLEERIANLQKVRKALLQEVEQALKAKPQPLKPPALKMTCEDNPATVKAATDWAFEAGRPETALLQRLHAVRTSEQFAGLDDTATTEASAKLVTQLMGKAKALLKDSKADYTTIPAVTAFVFSVAHSGASIGQDQSGTLMSQLAAWLKPHLPAMLKVLREEHDYTMGDTIIRLVRWLNSWGISSGAANVDQALEDIRKALSFRLTLDFTFTSTGANGNVETFHLKAEVPLEYRVVEADRRVKAILVGEGQGRYLSYTESDGQLTMQAPNFPVQVKIEKFDPCAGTAQLFLDRFYADRETYIFHDGTSAPLGIAMVAWMVIFQDKMGGGGWNFDLNVANRQVKAVDQTYGSRQGVFSGDLTITLEHQPK